MMIGTTELILVLVIVFVIFGAGKLPDVARSLGKGLKSFKDEANKPDSIDVTPKKGELGEESKTEVPEKKAEESKTG